MDKVRDKVRYNFGNSRIQILRTEILKSDQAIYFLRMEDPEIIPGKHILSQDRGS